MPSIEVALRAVLLEDGDVVTLVGERIYPQNAPLNVTPPYVVYSTSDFDQELALDGYRQSFEQVFRWDCFGGSLDGRYRSSKQIGSAVRSRLFGWLRGDVEGGLLTVEGILAAGGEDGQEVNSTSEEGSLDTVSVVARVFWRAN